MNDKTDNSVRIDKRTLEFILTDQKEELEAKHKMKICDILNMRRLVVRLAVVIVVFWGGALNINSQQWISAPESGGGMPLFQKTFRLEKPVRSAVLSASALGVYTLTVNGVELDDAELKPGWTDYRKEIFFQTSPLPKHLLKTDTLNVSAQVSNGWWIGGITRGVYGVHNRHAFICWIDVTYKDGSSVRLVSDSSWLCSTDGPLRMGDIYNGETYDARQKPERWRNVVENQDVKCKLTAQMGPDVKVRDMSLWRHPQSITVYEGAVQTGTTYGKINVVRKQSTLSSPVRLKKGQTLLVDFGQNMVGWVNFTVRGETGTQLTWRFGEMLNYNGDEARLDKGPGGSLWTYNLRTADATLRYVMKGGGEETYHPRHTFFGFRYAELTATGDVEVTHLEGQVVGSDIKEWGRFECSNTDINRLYQNIWWSQRGNFLSIPTDCPQRDERLGWTGDTQIFSVTALYNSDVKDFYRKWMRDLRNGQREDGSYPCTAPFANMWGYGGSAWGDAGIIVPYNVYSMTGDKQILEENYESMQRWVEHCAEQREGDWTHIGAETDFGDWLAYKQLDKRFVSYAYYAHICHLMWRISCTLNKWDHEKYLHLRENIIDEFQRRYVTDDRLNTGQDTQTAYLLALRFGLLRDDTQRHYAMKSLRKNIEENGYRLSTGFVGTGILMETLTLNGMDDLAYRLLLQRDNPSWLYSIDQGATTVWERWDSYTLADGFNKHEWNMNSFNHYSYGAVAEWFYSTILGIRLNEPGFSSIVFRPRFGGGLTWARGGTMTPYGRIDVQWRRMKNGDYRYTVKIPSGREARIEYDGVKNKLLRGDGRQHTFVLPGEGKNLNKE